VRLAFTSILALTVVAIGVSSTLAQEPQDRLRQGVLDRNRPQYTARGMRAGGFLVYPALNLTTAYDSNIFATDTNKAGAWTFEERPEIAVESNFPRHALYGRAEVVHRDYFSHSSENRTDYYLNGGGRLDIVRTTNIHTDVQYQKDTEDRGSPDADGFAAEPVDFTRLQVLSEIRHHPGRLSLDGGAVYQEYRFDNVPLIGGGFQNNEDRDRDVLGGYSRIGYQLSPGYEVFVLGLYSHINYRLPFDDNFVPGRIVGGVPVGFNRDSNGYQIEGGTRLELTNVIAGDVSVGYFSRNYDDPLLPTINGVSTEVNLEWYVSRLTTVRVGGSRRVQETTLDNASGYVETGFDAAVDHELLRNLILTGFARYEKRKYEGISRDDDDFTVSARALYLLNRNLSVAAEYRYENRDSTAIGQDYARNVVQLTLRGQI
jgi:hypothetical protein